MVICVSLLNTIFLYSSFVILFISHLCLFSFYFLNIILSFWLHFLFTSSGWYLLMYMRVPFLPILIPWISWTYAIYYFRITCSRLHCHTSKKRMELICFLVRNTVVIELPVPLNLEITRESFTPWLEITPLVASLSLAENSIQKGKGIYCNTEYILFASKKRNNHVVY